MMLRSLMMMSLSLALLASCASFTGNFCDLAVRLETDEATARYIVQHDRALIIEMNVHNRLLDQCPD
jgi:hypothetical protein